MIVTIDGPSGSGKSTLALMLAKELNFFCLYSGYIYRGLAYILKTFYAYDQDKFSYPNISDIQICIKSGSFCYVYEYEVVKIYFGSDNITQFLKSEEISKLAAILAQNQEVLEFITWYQRELVQDKNVIIEGRAGGSIVFPQADIKFFMIATVEIRAKRLQVDQQKRGQHISYELAMASVISRDQLDISRKFEPLIKPADAIVLNTSEMSKEDTFKKALSSIKNKLK